MSPLPRVVAFDLDQTLAESKAPITPGMATLLASLLEQTLVAITSGGKLEQLIQQVAEQLPLDARLERLILLPTSGAALYTFDTETKNWNAAYEELLSPEEVAAIIAALEAAADETGVIDPNEPVYGPRIENRRTQVAYSGVGQEAPIAVKRAWDPDRRKRSALQEAAAKRLPDYDVKTGGSTTVDVTRHGVNKAYGLRRLEEHLSIPIAEMLYIGDALYPGGNDEVVKETGIRTQQVIGPDETASVIRTLLAEA